MFVAHLKGSVAAPWYSGPVDFELSAMNLSAMDKALKAAGRREEVYALLSPEARASFEDPHSARWHPGRFAVEAWMAIIKLSGMPWLEELNYQLTRQSFGPVVGPLVKIGLTLSGSSPASIFSRLGDLVSLALRGPVFEWKAAGPQGGAETISYPCAVPADAVEAGWRGIFRVGGEMTGKTIRVEKFEAESDRRFRFEVSW